MNIKLTVSLLSLLCTLHAVDCKDTYNKNGCNETLYSLDNNMYIYSYDVLLDSDQDLVSDNLDKCPDTPLLKKVNKDGCASIIKSENIEKNKNAKEDFYTKDIMKMSLEVSFDSRKSDFKDEYLDEVRKFANLLKDNPTYSVKIIGHTDSRAEFMDNTILSLNRAKSVLNTLVSFGVEKRRLTCEGLGSTEPISTNATALGRAENRRIEVILTKEEN